MLGEWAREDKIDEDVETTKTTKTIENEPSKDDVYYEEYTWANQPATVFYAVILGVIFIGFIPWVIGWIKIFQWIF